MSAIDLLRFVMIQGLGAGERQGSTGEGESPTVTTSHVSSEGQRLARPYTQRSRRSMPSADTEKTMGDDPASANVSLLSPLYP